MASYGSYGNSGNSGGMKSKLRSRSRTAPTRTLRGRPRSAGTGYTPAPGTGTGTIQPGRFDADVWEPWGQGYSGSGRPSSGPTYLDRFNPGQAANAWMTPEEGEALLAPSPTGGDPTPALPESAAGWHGRPTPWDFETPFGNTVTFGEGAYMAPGFGSLTDVASNLLNTPESYMQPGEHLAAWQDDPTELWNALQARTENQFKILGGAPGPGYTGKGQPSRPETYQAIAGALLNQGTGAIDDIWSSVDDELAAEYLKDVPGFENIETSRSFGTRTSELHEQQADLLGMSEGEYVEALGRQYGSRGVYLSEYNTFDDLTNAQWQKAQESTVGNVGGSLWFDRNQSMTERIVQGELDLRAAEEDDTFGSGEGSFDMASLEQIFGLLNEMGAGVDEDALLALMSGGLAEYTAQPGAASIGY